MKYYPAGATTNSDSGVTSLDRVYPVLAAMEKRGMVLSLHGEVTDADVDMFDRERVFVDTLLARIVRDFPGLKVVLEHVTTREAAAFVREAATPLAATITPQHLLWSRNALFVGGIRPHYYCLPILKRETHRQALVAAATSGDPRFFLGTDSAPHARHTKENACGCAGCYSAPIALELYAEAFEDAGALDRLRGIRERLRRGLLRPAAQRGHGHAGARAGWRRACRLCRSARTRSCRCARASACGGARARAAR